MYHADGTFDRVTFLRYVRRFIKSGNSQVYPHKNSVWILDGAKIHLDKELVNCLVGSGIRVVFLPSYCPFYSPLEYGFGYMKRRCKISYAGKGSELTTLMSVLRMLKTMDMRQVYVHCGYMRNGSFNGLKNFPKGMFGVQ